MRSIPLPKLAWHSGHCWAHWLVLPLSLTVPWPPPVADTSGGAVGVVCAVGVVSVAAPLISAGAGDSLGGEQSANESLSFFNFGDLSSPSSLPTLWHPTPRFVELDRELGDRLVASALK